MTYPFLLIKKCNGKVWHLDVGELVKVVSDGAIDRETVREFWNLRDFTMFEVYNYYIVCLMCSVLVDKAGPSQKVTKGRLKCKRHLQVYNRKRDTWGPYYKAEFWHNRITFWVNSGFSVIWRGLTSYSPISYSENSIIIPFNI